MLFRLIYDEALAHASYLIGCQQTREAIVFDPARDIDRYMGLAASHGLRITATAETHIHADFLSGCGELARRCGAHVYVSGHGGPDWQSRWVDDHSHTLLKDGDSFELGGLQFRALHTPGHTPEHLMYEVIDRPSGPEPLGLITGDFVFVGALGRPDLLEKAMGQEGVQEQCARDLHASASRFLELPDFLQVWPAHGSGSACGKSLGSVPQSTVGYERRTNPSLAFVGKETQFIDDILSGQSDPPLYFERMKRLNRDGVPPLQLTAPPVLTAEECETLDLDKVVVVDTRPWELFRQSHFRNSHWSAPGAWFPASVGSYIEPEQSVALLVEPDEAEHYLRLMLRIGLDRIVGMITPEVFKEAIPNCETSPANEIHAAEFQREIEAGSTRVLDVRSTEEYARGRVPGSCHVPYTRLAKHLDSLPPVNDEPLLVHCQGGLRSAMALTYLKRLGYNPVNIAGGYAAWVRIAHRQNA
tara:strand:+ start:7688 stop:9103 length:1416 start_codon:yes stop_codon:yes gene_type:complete